VLVNHQIVAKFSEYLNGLPTAQADKAVLEIVSRHLSRSVNEGNVPVRFAGTITMVACDVVGQCLSLVNQDVQLETECFAAASQSIQRLGDFPNAPDFFQ
jgi:hypothetical protein